MSCRTAPMQMTLSDHEGNFCCLKPFSHVYLGKCSMSLHVLYKISLQMNRKAHVTCNFNCFFRNSIGRHKGAVTVSHVHCKCGNVSETVQDRIGEITNKKSYIGYQTAAIPMTLSDLQGHSPTASLFKCNFSYSCAALDKISTEMSRRAVSLR